MTVKAKPTNGLEHKYTSLKSLKAVNEGPGGFEGYVSVFSVIDEGGDLILPGAYKDVIDSYLSSGFTAESHNWGIDGMIGMPVEAREDLYGLYVKTIFHGTPDAQNVRQKIQERLDNNKEVGQSIGYKAGNVIFIQPKDYESQLPQYLSKEFLADGLEKAKSFPRIRVLTSIADLKENSVVTAPMNTYANVDSVKNADELGEQLPLIDDAAPGTKTDPPADTVTLESLTAEVNQLKAQIADNEIKIGATISASNKKKLQQIHDNAAAMEATVCGTEKSAVVVGDQVKGMYEDALAEMTTPTLWQVYYAFLDVLDMIEDLPANVGETAVDKPALIEEALAAMVTAMREAALAKLDEPDVEYIYWGAPPESFKSLSSDLVSEPFDVHSLAVVSAAREHATRSGAIKEAVVLLTDRAKEKQEFRSTADGRPVSALARARKADLDKALKEASANDSAAAEKSESLTLLEPEDLSAQMRAQMLRTQRLRTHALASKLRH